MPALSARKFLAQEFHDRDTVKTDIAPEAYEAREFRLERFVSPTDQGRQSRSSLWVGLWVGILFRLGAIPQNRLDRTISYISAMPSPLTVAAPTCRGCGAIRSVGALPARRRGRRLRQSALPTHPVRQGRPTRQPLMRLRHQRRLSTGVPHQNLRAHLRSTSCNAASQRLFR